MSMIRESFEKNNKSKLPSKVQPSHQKLAIRLRNAIAASRLSATRNWSIKGWGKEILMLMKKSNLTEGQILQSIEWLDKNRKLKTLPVIRSAKSFKEKFPKLEELMTKSGQTITEFHPEVTRIVEKLKNKHPWTIVQLNQLPAACQVTYDNYTKFRQQFVKELTAMTNSPNYLLNKTDRKHKNGLFGFPERLKQDHLHYPPEFVQVWFNDIYRLHKNNSYHSLMDFVFTVDSERFNEWGKELAHQYGNSTLWEKTLTRFGLQKERN